MKLALCFGAFFLAGWAAVPLRADAAPVRQVIVSGEASIKVAPDQMNWTVDIAIDDSTLARAKARHDASLSEALTYLKGLGAAIQDLQTGGIRFEKRQYIDKNSDVKPFACSTEVTFTLTDFAQYGPIADKLSGLDGAQVQSVDYAYSKAEETHRAALVQALDAAHEKANNLAVAAHCYIDRPLTISEGDGGGVRPLMGRMMVAAPMGGTPDAISGQLEISAQITVTYDLFYK